MNDDNEPDAMLRAILTLVFIGVLIFLGAIILSP